MWEYFRISGDNIAIMNDCRSIKKFRSGVHTAYGKYVVRSEAEYVYRWRFKINKGGDGWIRFGDDEDDNDRDGVLVIGIASKIMLNVNEG
eukprot:CAMPEP_0197068654 /NCGR_PEP_ID=MMETSP1384-20130603/188244_1 /TAXON_ID=29189 /ORGANISM="Ammonia sp." /LENGTH=89 /DNA_ID=CAMNT_0042506443 /DNA_START=1 /DNA_END=266 /DNA_ORIENTATION=-